LIRGHLGSELIIDDSLGVAGGFVASAGDAPGRHGVFYATSDRMAGPALVWALRSGIDHLHLVAEAADAGALARRVGEPTNMRVEVLAVSGVDLIPVAPLSIEPAPTLDPSAWDLAPIISEAGARPVDDHGRIVAEVAGLEVARIVQPSGEPAAIEVGVGEADRELHALVHSTMDSGTAIRRAVAMVAAERRRNSMHPLARIARERWLRSVLLDDPGLVGARVLESVPPLRARSTVLGNVPSAAVGELEDGRAVVVVCSTGIDLDVVPEATDYRRRESTEAELIIVVPERDRHATTASLVEITPDASLRSIESPW
jgi:hypothetical protein